MDHVEVLRELQVVLDWINRLPIPTRGATAQGIRLADAITALSAKPEGEAVAWRIDYSNGTRAALFEAPADAMFKACGAKITPLYTHPPRSHGVVVDEAMKRRAWIAYSGSMDDFDANEARIEAALVAALGGNQS